MEELSELILSPQSLPIRGVFSMEESCRLIKAKNRNDTMHPIFQTPTFNRSIDDAGSPGSVEAGGASFPR